LSTKTRVWIGIIFVLWLGRAAVTIFFSEPILSEERTQTPKKHQEKAPNQALPLIGFRRSHGCHDEKKNLPHKKDGEKIGLPPKITRA